MLSCPSFSRTRLCVHLSCIFITCVGSCAHPLSRYWAFSSHGSPNPPCYPVVPHLSPSLPSPCILSLAASNLLFSSAVFSIKICYINGIILYPAFGIAVFFSLSTILWVSSKSLRVSVVCCSSLSLSAFHMWTGQFTSPRTGWRTWGCFQFSSVRVRPLWAFVFTSVWS